MIESKWRIKDISGKKFGNWTAISFVGIGTRNQSIWKFQCGCGNTIEEYAYIIKGGNKKNCGCVRGKDISGMKFGMLTALRHSDKRLSCRPSYFWVCRCDCGNEVDVWISNLLNGHTRSCGCLVTKCLIERNTTHGKYYTKEHARFRARRHRERYGGREPEWSFDMEMALSSFFPQCVLCGSVYDLETDHVIPKSKGGVLRPGNAVKLCSYHNGMAFKGGKMPDELDEESRNKILSAAQDFNDYWNSTFGGDSK
jgi:5-methylcytosine-specific restriction endonuclease McrA